MNNVVLAPGSYLTPLSIYKDKRARAKYLCKCICGKEILAGAYELKRGSIKSCGCKRTEMLKNCNTRRANSLHNYAMRWKRLEEAGAKSPALNSYLRELAKEYPVYV